MLSLASTLLAILLALALLSDAFRKRISSLPPGPVGVPVMGHILLLPRTFLFRKLHGWAQEHGPLYTFRIFAQPYVVLSDVATAADILDRRSAVTSDRPVMIKAQEFYFKDRFFAMEQHTVKWRAERRAVHTNLNIREVSRFGPAERNEAVELILGLLRHPNIPLHQHIHRFTTSITACILFGHDPLPLTGKGADRIKRVEDVTNEAMAAILPQNSLVDTLPILSPIIRRVKWFRKAAEDWNQKAYEEATRLYKESLSIDQWGTTTVAQDLKANMTKYELTEYDAVYVLLQLYMGGHETSHTALRVFMLAMLHHSEARRAAQNELDAVCGDRPPSFADKDHLPYIQATIKETLRWRPGAPLGVPHRVSETFEYRGHIIPKNTVLLDNIWSQTRDISVYKDAEAFDPSRFLDDFGNLRPVTPDTRLDQLGFGHGRRVCPGRDLAFNSMFIASAFLLWAFEFEWPVDENGLQVTCGVDDFIDNGLIVTPKPFEVIFKPRKEGLENRLRAA